MQIEKVFLHYIAGYDTIWENDAKTQAHRQLASSLIWHIQNFKNVAEKRFIAQTKYFSYEYHLSIA